MLYLDRLTLHNFKSFKHANIRFSQGFNCILGPNGSGKSNICDSLLFVLGETSLRRMRVRSSIDLINAGAKSRPEDGLKRAYVQVIFSGDTPIEITRIIRSNNKVLFKLNGKRVTRQEVIDALLAYKSGISEVNTITQGEIVKLVDLNPKERRELIDVASGIKEFEDKKDAALRELEKVQQRVNEVQIQLGERSGYLTDLEKQKRDAERFVELSKRIRSANYAILRLREKELEAQYATASSNYEDRQRKRTESETKSREIDLKVESLNAEKSELARKLSESSAESSSVNQLLNEVDKEIATKTSKVEEGEANIKRQNDRMSRLSTELEELRRRGSEISKALPQKIADMERKTAETKVSESGLGAEIRRAVGDYETVQKELDALKDSLRDAESDYDMEALSIDSASKSLSAKKAEAEQVGQHHDRIKIEIESAISKSKSAADAIAAAKSELDAATKLSEVLSSKIAKIDSDSLGLRQALAMQGGASDRMADAIKREIPKGFYGKAYELCSYEDKYAIAVQAAAGARLNYLVVDSIETADRAIALLKAKSLGRASFIPLNDIESRPERTNGMKPLIDLVEFDKKYSKAFEYIFSDTYVIDDIKQSKKIGAGRFRFVTLEGELVEPSGLVTGGSMRALQSPALIESKLRALDGERSSAAQQLKEVQSAIDRSKGTIGQQGAVESVSGIELGRLESDRKDAAARLNELESEIKALNAEISRSKVSLESAAKRKEELSGKKADLDRRAADLHDTLLRAQGPAQRQPGKAKAPDYKALQEEIAGLNKEIGSLDAERRLAEDKCRGIDAEISEIKGDIRASKELIESLAAELRRAAATHEELKAKIESYGSKSAESYRRQTELEGRIQALSMERGRLGSEMQRLSESISELAATKGQLQMRLGDVKSELAGYQDASGLEKIEVKDIESLQTALAEMKHDQEALGAVNLKAIEDYEVKKKDVDEAKQRLDTLQSERASVLQMIEEIETKKVRIFTDTFNSVNENLKKLYGYVSADSVSLALDNPADPFNSGMTIKLGSKDRKGKVYETMSGGEKSMLMLALIFAIQMLRPMAFYVFDEIDAALDKENSKKLSSMIQQMGRQSQFIVVSHNDTLVAAADTAIGVSMHTGMSSAVGLQIGHSNSERLVQDGKG